MVNGNLPIGMGLEGYQDLDGHFMERFVRCQQGVKSVARNMKLRICGQDCVVSSHGTYIENAGRGRPGRRQNSEAIYRLTPQGNHGARFMQGLCMAEGRCGFSFLSHGRLSSPTRPLASGTWQGTKSIFYTCRGNDKCNDRKIYRARSCRMAASIKQSSLLPSGTPLCKTLCGSAKLLLLAKPLAGAQN